MQLDNDKPTQAVLRERLVDWTDIDVAAYHLGCVLGVLPPMEDRESDGDHFRRLKGIFWASNPLGDALYEALLTLAEVGILERQPDVEYGIHSSSPLRFANPGPSSENDAA